MNVIDILAKYHDDLIAGLMVTVKLSVLVWAIGIAGGILIGSLGSRWRFVGWPSRVASFVLTGMPVLVLLFWLHYPVQYELGIVVDPFITAVVTLSLINAFAVADLVRGTLEDFPQQYLQAARVTGLTSRQTLVHVQLPIVWRQLLPPMLSLQITMLQATLFASLISVDEIFRVAQRINSEIYRPVEVYTSLAIFFLAVCLPLHGLAMWLRARFTRNLSER